MEMDSILYSIENHILTRQNYIQIGVGPNRLSIHIRTEEELCKVFNVAYELNLHKVDYEDIIMPALLYLDDSKRTAFLVLESNSSNAINWILNQFPKYELDKICDQLYFFILKGINEESTEKNIQINQVTGIFKPDYIHFLDCRLFCQFLRQMNDKGKLLRILNTLEHSKDHQIYDTLIKYDNGYEVTATELQALANVKELTWENISCLPHCMHKLSELTELYVDFSSQLKDISPLSEVPTLKKLILNQLPDLADIHPLSKLKSLTELELSNTGINNISPLKELKLLTTLRLFYNTNLSDIYAIGEVKSLQVLSLSHNKQLSDISPLTHLNSLRSLDLTNSKVTNIESLNHLKSLEELYLSRVRVDDISPLSDLKNLKILYLDRNKQLNTVNALKELTSLMILDVSSTHLYDISGLCNLHSLTYLDLSSNEALKDISPLGNLKSLRYLDLSWNKLNDISILSTLPSLNVIDLHYATLTFIPESVLHSKLDFLTDTFAVGPGIYISGLTLRDQPIEIFYQQRDLIRAYYSNDEKVPINECKIIFLGDAESGKTHSIKRLLENGAYLNTFDGNSTPGIEISVSPTKIGDIAVNYWDFGGQEIQHSMHRMFLTARTVYVVFLNARQDPLDERARYWLDNIKSFAPGAPVLLVINKIDQNDRPRFNEDSIRDTYPDLIKNVVRMSALKDTPEIFLKKLQDNIKEIIGQLPTVKSKIPTAWKSLMEDIRVMPNPYMTSKEFQERCLSRKVQDYEAIHEKLVDLFQVIGISFCYYKDRSIADYMILNPKWLVNALYTIVTNSGLISTNGIISQNNLYDVLMADSIRGETVKRVIPALRYEGAEINYILGVTRMFRLSYPLKDGSEFFPMLCDGNEKISLQKALSENALHYIFRYTYLPSNVLHELIVEMQKDIDYRYVWYYGAVLTNQEQSHKAYICSKGNDLHVYVESMDSFYNPNEYLTPIQNNIRAINQELGLSAKEFVTYRIDGKEIAISFKKLKGRIENGLFTDYDEELEKVIDYRDVAQRYENKTSVIKNKIIRSISFALRAMQNDVTYYKGYGNSHDLENRRNRFVSAQLRMAGYNCSDQQTGGTSTNGYAPGERDVVISDDNNQDLLLYEGLNLEYVDKTEIHEHLGKIIEYYNPQDLPCGVIAVYLECTREKFRDFVERYKSYISQHAPKSYEILGVPKLLRITEGQLFNCLEVSYQRGGSYFTLYHMIVRIGA